MGDVIKFNPLNAHEDPDHILEQCAGVFDDVLIIGYNKSGDLEVRASSEFADGGSVLFAIETFKHNLLNGNYSTDEY